VGKKSPLLLPGWKWWCVLGDSFPFTFESRGKVKAHVCVEKSIAHTMGSSHWKSKFSSFLIRTGTLSGDERETSFTVARVGYHLTFSLSFHYTALPYLKFGFRKDKAKG